jgi:hypothetical protein
MRECHRRGNLKEHCGGRCVERPVGCSAAPRRISIVVAKGGIPRRKSRRHPRCRSPPMSWEIPSHPTASRTGLSWPWEREKSQVTVDPAGTYTYIRVVKLRNKAIGMRWQSSCRSQSHRGPCVPRDLAGCSDQQSARCSVKVACPGSPVDSSIWAVSGSLQLTCNTGPSSHPLSSKAGSTTTSTYADYYITFLCDLDCSPTPTISENTPCPL